MRATSRDRARRGAAARAGALRRLDRLAERSPKHRDLSRVVERVLDLAVDQHIPGLIELRPPAAELRHRKPRDLAPKAGLRAREPARYVDLTGLPSARRSIAIC